VQKRSTHYAFGTIEITSRKKFASKKQNNNIQQGHVGFDMWVVFNNELALYK